MNNEKISGRETATGKAIDREELYSFLLRFANTVFHDFEFAIKTIGVMRYGEGFTMPAVRYPQNFEMRTDAELTAEIEKAPTFSKAMLAQQYLETRFPIQEEKSAIMKLSVQADPLFNLETKDVLALVSTGLVPKWKAVMHFELESLIRSAIDQNEQFLTLTLEEQKNTLASLAKTLVPEEEQNRTLTSQNVMSNRTVVANPPAPAENEEEEKENND